MRNLNQLRSDSQKTKRQGLLVLGSLTFFALLLLSGCASPQIRTGTWSAPSLSRPEEPILITLRRDGVAMEKIGDFRGRGIWRREGDVVWIDWASGWKGLLRPSQKGGFELLTWKSGASLKQAPADVQKARYLDQRDQKP